MVFDELAVYVYLGDGSRRGRPKVLNLSISLNKAVVEHSVYLGRIIRNDFEVDPEDLEKKLAINCFLIELHPGTIDRNIRIWAFLIGEESVTLYLRFHGPLVSTTKSSKSSLPDKAVSNIACDMNLNMVVEVVARTHVILFAVVDPPGKFVDDG